MSKNKPIQKFLKFLKNLKSVKRVWPYLRESKKTLFTCALLIPVISALQASLPFVLQHVIDNGIKPAEVKVIYVGCSLFFVIVAFEYVARVFQSYLGAKAFNFMTYKMRSHLISHVMKLSPRFHDTHLSGSLVTRCTSDFDSLNESLSEGLLNSIVDIAILIGALIGMYFLSPTITGYFLIVLPFLMVTIYLFSKKLKQTIHFAREKVAILNGFAQECLFGAATIKTLNSESFAKNKFKTLSKNYRNAQMKSVFLDAFMFAILEGLASVTIGLIFWVLFFAGKPNEAITAGVLIGSIQYIQKVFEPLKHLSNKIAILQGAFTALDRIFALFAKNEFIEGDETFDWKNFDIAFSKTSFRYNKELPPILKNIDLKIPEGSSMAIVGPTGSGKSTLIKILSKMYDGYSGSVTIGNKELARINPDEFRSVISIVPQDIVLFTGSIEFNITLGRPGISKQQAFEAAKTVGLLDFIETLPNKLETMVLEDGKNLSYGQRQLIIFARAIVTNPKLLILDEATSTVDLKTELSIQKALRKISKKRTMIVIAHRLSTIKESNKIAYIADGEIKELGSHEQLLEKKGFYSGLYQGVIKKQPMPVN